MAQVMVWLFLFLLPTQLGKHFFMDFSYINGVRIDYLAPALYVTDLLLILLVALYWRLILKALRQHRKTIVVVICFIIAQMLDAKYPFVVLYTSLKLFEVWLAFVLFSSLKLPKRSLFTAFIAGACVQLLIASVQLKTGASIQGVFYYLGERLFTLSSPGIAKASLMGEQFLRPYGTFSHPNSLGGFYALLFAWTLSLRPKTHSLRILRLILGALCGMLILISFSKAAIISTAAVGVWYVWQNRHKLTCLPCTVGRLLIGASLAGIFLMAHGDSFSTEKRLFLIQQGIDIIKHHPLLGTGLGHHLYAQAPYPTPYPYFFLQPVHNIFIVLIMQVGLPAGGWILWKFLQWGLRNWTHIALPALIILLTGSADHYWLTLQQNMLLLGTIAGIISLSLKE